MGPLLNEVRERYRDILKGKGWVVFWNVGGSFWESDILKPDCRYSPFLAEEEVPKARRILQKDLNAVCINGMYGKESPYEGLYTAVTMPEIRDRVLRFHDLQESQLSYRVQLTEKGLGDPEEDIFPSAPEYSLPHGLGLKDMERLCITKGWMDLEPDFDTVCRRIVYRITAEETSIREAATAIWYVSSAPYWEICEELYTIRRAREEAQQ